MMILEILMMMMTMKLTELNICLTLLMFLNEPLYFVKVTEKRSASENHSDPYDHFISAGEKVSKRFYLKLVQSRNTSKKKKLLPTEIVFLQDEIFDTYVEFSEDLHIDTNTYNILIQKVTLILKFKACFIIF